MKFTIKILKNLSDTGQEICIFSDEFSSLLFQLSSNYFKGFSIRSYYFWRNKERPIPLSVVVALCKDLNLKFLEIQSFSIKGGNLIKFPKFFNEELSYFLGIILGDGCLIHQKREKRNSWCVQVTSSSLEKINFLESLVKSLFGADAVHYSVRTYYQMYIFSKPLVMLLAELYELPVGLKYDTIKVPEIVKKNNIWKRAFIKGVFECDGNIYKHRSGIAVQLRQKSKSFLDEIRLIGADLGIFFHEPYYDRANNSWVLWTCKKSVVDNFINKIIHHKIKLP
ncbi:hypothetical protein CMI41_01500 [Candidatus Pacearchaeota archaeon]|nr:hypothetical protein [Candidatus Pacearchaeota archaeon]|tara:strand:- start:1364 stop:2206 length:843 start_codon:yes stop_codon:yes gene_type:complete